MGLEAGFLEKADGLVQLGRSFMEKGGGFMDLEVGFLNKANGLMLLGGAFLKMEGGI